MAVYLQSGTFYIPTEGVMTLLGFAYEAMCAGCGIEVAAVPPEHPVYMGLYATPTTIVEATVLGDLGLIVATQEELNAEATAPWCEGNIEGPSVQPDGVAALIFDQKAITLAADSTIAGVAVYANLGSGAVLLGAFPFDLPIGGLTGDIFKVSGVMPVAPQLPA